MYGFTLIFLGQKFDITWLTIVFLVRINEKNRDKLPICPTCQTRNDVIPSLHGRPTRELALYAAEGNVKLSELYRWLSRIVQEM